MLSDRIIAQRVTFIAETARAHVDHLESFSKPGRSVVNFDVDGSTDDLDPATAHDLAAVLAQAVAEIDEDEG